MSEKVEQVARALFASWITDYGHAGFPDCVEYDELSEVQKTFAIKQARAAIAAMREPTEAMGEAGAKIPHQQMIFPSHAESVWRAMIDKALE